MIRNLQTKFSCTRTTFPVSWSQDFAFLFNSCHKLCNSSPSTAKHLSSWLPSVLPFCSTEGPSGICFAPLVSSVLSRGTWWIQQHTGLTSFPWCPYHVSCCSSSWLNPAFLRFFPPPQSFIIYYLGPSQDVLVQLFHEAYFRTLSPLPSPLAIRDHHSDPSSVGHDKHRLTAHLSQIQSKSVSEVPHPVTWWVTEKVTCRTFVVNFSLSLKWGVSDHAKGICVWGSVWAGERPKKILPCPFGLQSDKYIFKIQQQLRFGPNFIMFKVTKGFNGNRDIPNFC